MENFVEISRRHCLSLALAGVASSFVKPAIAAGNQPVLIELFTSQGCSSCPPADELAGELMQDPDNYVVSLNVDYWDYLGWRDTLAKPEYTQRQYDYAAVRGDGRVYTPQMIMNGADHSVGSNVREVKDKIAVARKSKLAVPLKLSVTDKEIKVEISAGDAGEETTLWLMAIEPQVKQTIARGENAGSNITYHNVVRNLVPAAMWKGEAYLGTWPRDAVMTQGTTFVMAVLQKGKVGQVLGLARS